jgi:hypothetical protein
MPPARLTRLAAGDGGAPVIRRALIGLVLSAAVAVVVLLPPRALPVTAVAFGAAGRCTARCTSTPTLGRLRTPDEVAGGRRARRSPIHHPHRPW